MAQLSGPALTIDLVRDHVIRKRSAGGLSQRALAKIVGASFSTVARFERGDQPAADHFLALAEWAGFRLVGEKS